MLDVALFVLLAAVWVIARMFIRRRVSRALQDGRLSARVAANVLAATWAALPFAALPWRPDLLWSIALVAAFMFAVSVTAWMLGLRFIGLGQGRTHP